jgi:uncharacterized membrane protein (DUF373 family)
VAPVESDSKRTWVARAFSVVEDIVYIGLGLLLAGSSLVLLVIGAINFGQNLMAGSFATNIVGLLDRILLILLFVELLYTVQVSFREHTIVPEPFLLVGLIAAIRRILVLTAEFADVKDQSREVFNYLVVELSVLSLLIIILVVSLFILRKRGGKSGAERTV